MAHDREFQKESAKIPGCRCVIPTGEDQPAARQTEQDFDLRRARDTPSSVNGKTHRQDIPVQTEFFPSVTGNTGVLVGTGRSVCNRFGWFFSEHFETPDAARTAPPTQDNGRSNFRQEVSRRSFCNRGCDRP